MPEQAVVIIKDKRWHVLVANTYAELTTGLSGVSSLPPQTGMLFDLGYDQNYIEIDMSRMLFALDIIFINSTQGVVGALHNVPPGLNATFHNEQLPGARCFLEVNAGEAEGIDFGDSVAIEGYTQPAQFDIGSLTNLVVIFLAIVMMVKLVDKTLQLPEAKPAILAQTRRELTRERKPKVATPRPHQEGKLEYLADSPEFLTQTIEATGYRTRLDSAFQEAIARAKGLK